MTLYKHIFLLLLRICESILKWSVLSVLVMTRFSLIYISQINSFYSFIGYYPSPSGPSHTEQPSNLHPGQRQMWKNSTKANISIEINGQEGPYCLACWSQSQVLPFPVRHAPTGMMNYIIKMSPEPRRKCFCFLLCLHGIIV